MWTRNQTVLAIITVLVMGMTLHPELCPTGIKEKSDSSVHSEITSAIRATGSTNLEAPYGEFCDVRPIDEKEVWNMRKKVISFSMYVLDDKKGQDIPDSLLGGLQANIELAKLYYPEWIVRVYVHNLSHEQIQQHILPLDTGRLEVVKCHDDSPINRSNEVRKRWTRFLVVDDPKVEYSIIRDLDSRYSIRELFAVNEWIGSGFGFHVMHDHWLHPAPVMAGMWGAKRGAITPGITTSIKQALKDYPNTEVPGCCQGDDQQFLTMYIWPGVKNDTISHDYMKEKCYEMGAKVCRKYPIGTREEEASAFVGARAIGTPPKNTHYECTTQCRFSDNDWDSDFRVSNL